MEPKLSWVEVDLSESFDGHLFGEPCDPEKFEFQVGSYTVQAKCLSKENQHTFKCTGLMVWESAYALGALLAANPSLVAKKTVLEVGCGCVGMCSLVAALHADRVIATDGDPAALELLRENLHLNAREFPVQRIACKKLLWGETEDLEGVKHSEEAARGIDVVIGTDVTYVAEAVPRLFETAGCLLQSGPPDAVLILCHLIRHVSEADIISTAAEHGFELKGVYPSDASTQASARESNTLLEYIKAMFPLELESSMSASSSALRLLCFALKD